MKRPSLHSRSYRNPALKSFRPLMQSLRDEGVLVPCKAAELGWETVSAVLESRFASGSMRPRELARAQLQYATMTTENATPPTQVLAGAVFIVLTLALDFYVLGLAHEYQV